MSTSHVIGEGYSENTMIAADTPTYAKVIVDVPSRTVDRPFDYAIPDALATEVRVGTVVAVPFGATHRVGYVVELADQTVVDRVSPVDSVLEPGPVFDQKVLDLCRWLSEYYFVARGEALRLAVPPGRGRRLVRRYRLTGATPVELGGVEKEIVAVLERGGSASLSALRSSAGAAAEPAVGRLVHGGLVEVFYETSRPTARERTVEYAALNSHSDEQAAQLCRAPRQMAIAEVLAEFGPMPVATLLAEARASRASLRALVARGLVTLERRAVPRRVDGGLAVTTPPAPRHLTQAQVDALDRITAAKAPECFLLDGVTGSGKTEVYIRAVEAQLAAGKGAIVLVPEISLTPQTVSRFRDRLGAQVAVMHSGLSVGQRYDQWMAVRGGTHRVVVGARSAIFAPVAKLGIIIVDEEHESSYKQNTSPRYHARDVAIRRAEISRCPIVLGTATPSLESYHEVSSGRATRLRLPGRVGGRPMPTVDVVDMREEFAAGNWSVFSGALEGAMTEALEAGEKVILFVNRRGFSSFLLCRDCGFVPRCVSCAVSLVFHERGDQLRCHHCDYAERAPGVCPQCGSVYLRHFGVGTQRVEDEMRARFEDVPIMRMDADTTKTRNSHARHLGDFAQARSAVLLGTQMVAKGHDFPEVTVVGVINADTALGLPDFRAAERTFQLLVQVSGRAGRGSAPGRVVIQTYWPDHYAIRAVAQGLFDRFYEEENQMRRQMGYPPFVRLINIGFSGADLESVRLAARAAGTLAAELPAEAVTVLGPAPAPLERIAGRHRWHMALKLHDEAKVRTALRPVLAKLELHRRHGVAVSVDVDPVSML